MCDLTSLRGTQLSVRVEEALPDIIVVSYAHDARIFRGVLLDATKRQLPCGITHLNPAFDAGNPDEDVLYAVKQRYAYTQISTSSSGPTQPARSLKNNKIGKMTVRLRPRQVLCSKCKDICNENSESITRKRKAPEETPMAPIAAPQAPPAATLPTVTSPAKRSANAPVTRSSHASLQVLQQELSSDLPSHSDDVKEAKSKKQSSVSALSGIVNKLNIVNNKRALSMSNQSNQNVTQNAGHVQSAEKIKVVDEEKDDKRLKRVILTRKKAGLIGDKEVEHQSPANSSAMSSNGSNTRTIKICYGPQREGTVLKIPAAIETLQKVDTEDEEDVPEENVVKVESASKASRKALKKAKKAKRKVTLHALGSPEQSTSRYSGAASSYSLGSSSPRYTVGSASPRHGLGSHSPRFVAALPPIPLAAFEPLPRKRKHKVKHKKRHKEDRDRKHKDDHDAKERDREEEKCLTQKLSINLKRLSGTYTTAIMADATSATSSAECHEAAGGDRNGSDCDDVGACRRRDGDEDSSEEVPDFPPGPLRPKLTAKNLNSALSAEGGQLIVGDVVWGKIQGFPWWPGKILAITSCESGPRPQAHVSWYGSSTSSLIQCESLSPYLANFKARYSKKKRGPYKEAIKQATNEARVLAELKNADVTPSSTTTGTSASASGAASSSSASPSRMLMLVQPPLASPREINVIS